MDDDEQQKSKIHLYICKQKYLWYLFCKISWTIWFVNDWQAPVQSPSPKGVPGLGLSLKSYGHHPTHIFKCLKKLTTWQLKTLPCGIQCFTWQSQSSSRQQMEEHRVVRHVQGEYHQSFFFTIYQEYLIHSLGLTLLTPGLVITSIMQQVKYNLASSGLTSV